MSMRWWLLLCALSIGAAPLRGLAQAPAVPPATERTEAPPVVPPPEAVVPPAGGPRTPAADDEFVPSEELAADEEVTFPIDI